MLKYLIGPASNVNKVLTSFVIFCKCIALYLRKLCFVSVELFWSYGTERMFQVQVVHNLPISNDIC